jgi:hypothetical protein
MDVAHHRLSKQPQMNDIPSESCRQFVKLNFSNNRIDAVILSNILCHKNVSTIHQVQVYPLYFLQIYPNNGIQTW